MTIPIHATMSENNDLIYMIIYVSAREEPNPSDIAHLNNFPTPFPAHICLTQYVNLNYLPPSIHRS